MGETKEFQPLGIIHIQPLISQTRKTRTKKQQWDWSEVREIHGKTIIIINNSWSTEGEWTRVHVCLSRFAVHPKPAQHCSSAVLIVNKKSTECSAWKQQKDLCSFLRQTIEHHSNPSLCLNHFKEAEWFYEDPQDLLEIIPKKRCDFHHRGLECKSRKSRDTQNNKQG